MRYEAVAAVTRCELGLLHLLDVGGHAAFDVVLRQIEHVVPHVVDAGQGDELVLVAHRTEFFLKLGDRLVVEVLLPVERRRAVVGQHLARVFGMHGVGKLARELQVRRAGFAPHEVSVVGVGDGARDCLLETLLGLVETFRRALAGDEWLVILVAVRGQQIGCFGIGTGDDQCRHAADVGGEARGDQFLDSFLGGHENLAAHVAAFLDRGQLVFPVHAGRSGANHCLHQFKGVQHTAKSGFGIGDDGCEVVDVALVAGVHVLGTLDLVGTTERVVDPLDDLRDRIDRIKRLIGVHSGVRVVVGGNLPAREIDSLDTSLHLLHRLAAGQCPQAVDERLVVNQVPELFGAATRNGVFDREGTTQADHIGSGIAALDALPAGILGPVFFQFGDLLFSCTHDLALQN